MRQRPTSDFQLPTWFVGNWKFGVWSLELGVGSCSDALRPHDTELGHTRLECGRLETEERRGSSAPANAPPGTIEHTQNVLALDVVQLQTALPGLVRDCRQRDRQ